MHMHEKYSYVHPKKLGSSTLETSVVQLASSFYHACYFTRWCFQAVAIPKFTIETSSLPGMNIWREDAFFHWKFCKLSFNLREDLPPCFLLSLCVTCPFSSWRTSNEKQIRDEWTFLFENFWPCNETAPWKELPHEKFIWAFYNVSSYFCLLSKGALNVSV